jgi:hypothetical protein
MTLCLCSFAAVAEEAATTEDTATEETAEGDEGAEVTAIDLPCLMKARRSPSAKPA